MRERGSVARPDVREVLLRLRVVLGLAALVGVSTGVIVAAFDKIVRDGMFAWVLRQPVALAAAIPAVGLLVAVLVSRLPGHADTATTDAYVSAYHERGGTLRVSDLWAKLAECAATLGSGGALGYEGPGADQWRDGGIVGRESIHAAVPPRRRQGADGCGRRGGHRRGVPRAAHGNRLRARGSLHPGSRSTRPASRAHRREHFVRDVRGALWVPAESSRYPGGAAFDHA